MDYMIIRDYSHTDRQQLFAALRRRVSDKGRADLKAHIEMMLPHEAEHLAAQLRKKKRHHRYDGQKVLVVAIIAEVEIRPDGPPVWPEDT